MSASTKIDEAIDALRMAQRHIRTLEDAARSGLSVMTMLRMAEQAADRIYEALAALGG